MNVTRAFVPLTVQVHPGYWPPAVFVNAVSLACARDVSRFVDVAGLIDVEKVGTAVTVPFLFSTTYSHVTKPAFARCDALAFEKPTRATRRETRSVAVA